MRQGERPLADLRGRFTRVVRNARRLDDADWTVGRILLSNRRMVLAADGGRRTIPTDTIENVGGRYDVNQRIAAVAGYVALTVGDDVLLVAPGAGDVDHFRETLFSVLLDQTTILVRHPAVAGGVVQNTDWERARLKVDDGALIMATVSNQFVEIPLDDVGGVTTSERTIIDETRPVVEIEHTDGGTSVQTYVSASPRIATVLDSFLHGSAADEEIANSLSNTEKQILMALYAGVSPFDIPSFVGTNVDEVEALYDRLLELGVLEELRVRREVGLSTRGRQIATEAISEQ